VVFIQGVDEDFQLVELLDLVHVKGTAGANEIVSELVTLFSKYELSWEKWLGLLVSGLWL
jgi:hypothetical protein